MPRHPSSIYFFGGSNDLLVREAAQQLADKLVPAKDRQFGLEIVNGWANNTDEALTALRRLREALDTIPFFGGEKLVWFKNTNLFAENQTTQSEATADALAALAASLHKGLPRGVTLLISATQVDKRRALFKTLEKIGNVQLFDLPDLEKGGRDQLIAFVAEKLKADGKTITAEAAQLLLELVGAAPMAYAQEVEKLALFTGERKQVTEQDVQAIVSATAEIDIWKLLDALSARNAPAAMKALDNLLAQKQSIIGIISLAAWNMRQALLLRDLMDRRQITAPDNYWQFKSQWERLPAAETAHFPRTKDGKPPSPFGLHRCALAAKQFTQHQLIAALTLLLETQRAIVTSGLDDRLLLEEAILKIIASGRRPAASEARVAAE
jgi:DNA polymerase-3 subunit delta